MPRLQRFRQCCPPSDLRRRLPAPHPFMTITQPSCSAFLLVRPSRVEDPAVEAMRVVTHIPARLPSCAYAVNERPTSRPICSGSSSHGVCPAPSTTCSSAAGRIVVTRCQISLLPTGSAVPQT